MNRKDAEKAIVGKLVDAFLAVDEVSLSVESDGYVDLESSVDKEEIMEALFAVDEAFLYVRPTNKLIHNFGWVFLVFGNDGYDVICDHTTGKIVSDVVNSLDDFISDIEDQVLGLK